MHTLGIHTVAMATTLGKIVKNFEKNLSFSPKLIIFSQNEHYFCLNRMMIVRFEKKKMAKMPDFSQKLFTIFPSADCISSQCHLHFNESSAGTVIYI
jgi:hypothetical protein